MPKSFSPVINSHISHILQKKNAFTSLSSLVSMLKKLKCRENVCNINNCTFLQPNNSHSDLKYLEKHQSLSDL